MVGGMSRPDSADATCSSGGADPVLQESSVGRLEVFDGSLLGKMAGIVSGRTDCHGMLSGTVIEAVPRGSPWAAGRALSWNIFSVDILLWTFPGASAPPPWHPPVGISPGKCSSHGALAESSHRNSTKHAMSLFGLIDEHEKEAGQRPEWTFSYPPEYHETGYNLFKPEISPGCPMGSARRI
jgi:hypothetical protein